MNIKLSKTKEIALVVILILIAINLTVSYSYFSVNTTHDNTLSTISGHVNCLDITYEEQNSLNLSGQYPVSDEWALANMTPVTITVENNCENTDERLNYTLALSTLRNATGFINDNQIRMHLKRTMYGDTEKIFKNTDYVSSLNQLEPGNALDFITQDLQTRGITSSYTNITNYVLDSTDIGAGETNTYRLYLWIDYYEGDTTHAGLNDNTTQNKQYKTALSLVLNADENVEAGYESAFDKVTTLASGITKYTGKVTDDPSQIGEGVDATKVYAFTSNENNNLVFANHCWQIRRTTETGGIKIQYNGEPVLGTSNGKTTYDCGTTRPYHIGSVKTTTSLSGTYLYGDGYTTSVSGSTTTFTLTNTQSVQVTSSNGSSVIPTLAGKYTCKNTTGTCTNANLYKVDSYSSSYNAYVYQSTNRDTIGISSYNNDFLSVSYVGYMYNSSYVASSVKMSNSTSVLRGITLDSDTLSRYETYLYSDAYTMSGNNHVLTNPVLGSGISNYPLSWVNNYMCTSSTNPRCSSMQYIAAFETGDSDPIIYVAYIDSGKQYNDVSYTYVFSNVVTDNGNGTFTMVNPQVVYKNDWYSNYSSLNNTYVCMPGYFNENNGSYVCNDNGAQNVGALRYVTEVNKTGFTASNVYKWGYEIVPNGNSYSLSSKSGEPQTLQYVTNWPSTNTTNCFANETTKISSCGFKSITKSHYSCLNLSGTCNTYYFNIDDDNTYEYSIPITGGKYVSTNLTDTNNVLYEMFSKSDINTINSTIKSIVDSWYEDNVLNTSFENLMDRYAVYCNDRRITDLKGWNPDGGITSLNPSFAFTEYTGYVGGSYDPSKNINCYRSLDSFSSANSSASLIYPIGLMTNPEIHILNDRTVTSSASSYWLMTPNSGGFNADNKSIYKSGQLECHGVSDKYGVRPAIVLNSNAEFSSGTGSTSDPWIVKGSEMTP